MVELSLNDKKSIFQKHLLAETLKRIDEETADFKEYKRISFKNAKKMSSILGFSVHWRPSAKQVIAILVAAAMLLLTGCGIAYRNEIRDFIIKNRGKGVSISFSEGPETEIKPIDECYNLNFVPEGFNLEQISKKDYSVKIKWANITGHYIYLHAKLTDTSTFIFDTEHGGGDFREISSVKIYYLVSNNIRSYIWNDGNYSFVVYSDYELDKQVLTQLILGFKKQ